MFAGRFKNIVRIYAIIHESIVHCRIEISIANENEQTGPTIWAYSWDMNLEWAWILIQDCRPWSRLIFLYRFPGHDVTVYQSLTLCAPHAGLTMRLRARPAFVTAQVSM